MGRKKRKEEDAQLELTPMIDVVFQLLIFFIVTLKTPEAISRLDVFRPAPDPDAVPENQPEEMVRVTVLRQHRFMLNQRPMGMATLKRNFKNIADRSQNQTILVQCAEKSSHHSLVSVLDSCAEFGLTNLNVMTLPPARPRGGG